MRMTYSQPARYAAPPALGCAGGCGCGCSGLSEAPKPMPEGSVTKLVLGFGAILGMMGLAVLVANKAEGR